MTDALPVRKSTWDESVVNPADVGELARDLAAKFSNIPLLKLVQFEALYTEPLYVSFDHNPVGIVVMRVRNKLSQEAPVLTGGTPHWVWDGTRAKINSIDGMSAGSGSTFIFDMLMVG
jgi:hypothetical protein